MFLLNDIFIGCAFYFIYPQQHKKYMNFFFFITLLKTSHLKLKPENDKGILHR